jgi:hypothetical protein
MKKPYVLVASGLCIHCHGTNVADGCCVTCVLGLSRVGREGG